jgi:D-threo-aldose 1-dehydrogenase
VIALPPIGLGTAPLGNLYREIPDAEARTTIEAALDAGFTYIDTAPRYGLGLAEKRLGEALRPGTIISTKVGRRLVSAQGPFPPERDAFFTREPFEPVYDYTHDDILRSYEDSLARLGRDRVEILYVHDIGRLTHGDAHPEMMAQLLAGGGLRALERLRSEGAIDGFGLGINETEVALELMDRAAMDIILLAGRYTLLEQGALTHFLPRCHAEGVAVVIGGPYNSGLLAGGGTYDYAPAPAPILARARAIEAVCERHGVPLAAAALQFPLAHPAVASVIPGLASTKEVHQTVQRYQTPIPPDLWAELKAEHLLAAEAPVPTGVPA